MLSRQRITLLGAFFGCAVSACSDDSDSPGGAAKGGAVALTNANNYTAESRLTIPSLDVAADADLDICWTDVISDLQCHEVDPAQDLNNVTLLRFLNLSHDDVEARLTSGELSQSEVDGFVEFNTSPDATCAKLSDMSFMGTPVEIGEEFTESDDHVYMLVLTQGTDPGVGARTMTFLNPSSSSALTEVSAPEGCGMLDFKADLSSLERVEIASEGPWSIEWRDVTRDSGGNEPPLPMVDRVMLTFYQDKDVGFLEENVFDIELVATRIWEIAQDGGRETDLALALDRETGEPFAGFETESDGVWLFGLLCSSCQNPAPLVLTVLDPK